MKIQKVDRHLGMTIAGGVADAQNLVDIMRYNANIYRLSKQRIDASEVSLKTMF